MTVNINNLSHDEVQEKAWDELENLSGEQVLRAFTGWHGMQLLTPDFLEYLSDNGYTTDTYEFEDDEDEEDEEEDD